MLNKRNFLVRATCIDFGPEDDYKRVEVVKADSHKDAEIRFKEEYGPPFDIDPEDIDIDEVREIL